VTPTPITLDDGRVLQPTGRRGLFYLPNGRTARVKIEGDDVRLFDPVDGGAEIEGGRIVAEAAAPPRKAKRPTAGGPDAGTAAGRFATFNTFIDTVAQRLSAAEVVVWMIMFRDCRNGIASTSHRDIVRRSGCSLRAVNYAIKRLRAAGLIKPTRLSRHRGEASQYAVHPNPDQCVPALMNMRPKGTGATIAPADKDHTNEPVQPLHRIAK
jgi:hypothetical protein